MPRASIGAAALFLAALACNLPIGSSPTSTPAPSETPSPTASPTPTQTPSPALRNEAARLALTNGDWELALRGYDRVIAESDDPDVLGEALYGRGEALLRDDRLAEAELTLSEYLSTNPDHARVPAALILRAQAFEKLGNPSAAAADYESYLAMRPGVIDAYVHEWLGDVLRQDFRPLEAVQHYEDAKVASGLPAAAGLDFKIGRAYLEAGQPSLALERFDQIYARETHPATRAAANLLAGGALEELGDLDGMYARFLDSFENYPEIYDTYLGLIRLVQDGVPVDDFQRGLVDYYAEAYEPAIAALGRALEINPSAEAQYRRGLSHRALGNLELAMQDLEAATLNYPLNPSWADMMMTKARTEWGWLDRYAAAVKTYLEMVEAQPGSPLAPQALFAAGRTAERSNDLERAAEIWMRLAVEYPEDSLAPAGAFEAGILRYRLADYSAAEQAFQRSLEAGMSGAQEARANLWIGKSRLAQGDEAGAQAALEASRRADPTGYYSLRAEHLLEGAPPFESSGAFNFSTDVEAEKRAAERWLKETFLLDASEPMDELSPVLASDPRLVRGLELWNLGMLEEAEAEFRDLRSALATDPEGTYRLMHTLLDLGLYREAIFASRQILAHAGLDDAATLGAPIYFNRVRFGPYFGDLILPEAARQGLDGLFLLSVVRQESLFQGFATSFAAARGLMQVIPSTGASIAGQLGWPPDYEASDLYRPIVSVRFGTHYLTSQADRFDGDLYAALAAYNGGPGNSIAWKELAPDDPDLFLEVIRFAETHRYIQVIYEVFEIYKLLYADG